MQVPSLFTYWKAFAWAISWVSPGHEESPRSECRQRDLGSTADYEVGWLRRTSADFVHSMSPRNNAPRNMLPLIWYTCAALHLCVLVPAWNLPYADYDRKLKSLLEYPPVLQKHQWILIALNRLQAALTPQVMSSSYNSGDWFISGGYLTLCSKVRAWFDIVPLSSVAGTQGTLGTWSAMQYSE